MRAEKYRDTSLRAATARGRMFLKAHLGWLPGVPLGQEKNAVIWLNVPRQEQQPLAQVRLERKQLHQAIYTWQKLVRRFPRALPRLVDDRDRWAAGVPELLAWLKQAIHWNRPLPASLLDTDAGFPPSAVVRTANLSRQQPALRPLLDALSWLLFLTPRELPEALTWLETNAAALTGLLNSRPAPE